ncbi:hypothetical protein [Pedobacter agri]|uniref:hypothetical protein n=1 Tax=Pedobacter agri TaxID=454586 RepID=UPI00292FD939|nr:hypothetical protein [Pedobacter agri]
MKNIYFIALLSIFSVNHLLAQESLLNSEKIDGNNLIEQLHNDRYQFNKKLIKHKGNLTQLPASQSILRSGKYTVTFAGRDYIIYNKQVVEISGIKLSKTALAAITNKLSLLDHLQKNCSETVNAEYKKNKRNLQYIKNIDRQYFSCLKQISSITGDISREVRKPNASVTIELAMDKVNVPQMFTNSLVNQEVLLAEIK